MQTAGDGVVVVPAGLRDHDRYTVWSYVAEGDAVPQLAAASSPLSRLARALPGARARLSVPRLGDEEP